MQKLILLHGALGSAEQLKPLAEQLKLSFEVLLFNFSGHGLAPFNENFSLEGFTKEVLVFMDEQKVEKACFFGYSMGGYVALNLAARNPDKVEKVFTLGTKFNWTPDTAREEIKNLNPLRMMEKVPAFVDVLKKRHHNWMQLVDKTAEFMMLLGKKEALKTEDFYKINVPVRIGIGLKDNMVSYLESAQISQQLLHGSIIGFENFKHPIEQIDLLQLSNELVKFLDE